MRFGTKIGFLSALITLGLVWRFGKITGATLDSAIEKLQQDADEVRREVA